MDGREYIECVYSRCKSKAEHLQLPGRKSASLRVAVAHGYHAAWLSFLCLALTSGCAQRAVRPPTPAKDLDPHDMWEPPPGEHFYITLFASQTTPRMPRLSHSWGTVLHVVDRGEDQVVFVESHTISWLPATLNIHPWNFHTEQAMNLNLEDSLRNAVATGQTISQWGPYECRPNLYHRFLVQKQFLESGQIGYQCIDSVGESARTGDGCDCIHAMTDMDPELSRNHYPLIRYGDAATRFVVRECRKRDVLINPDQVHAWLNAYLHLDAYPVVHRE